MSGYTKHLCIKESEDAQREIEKFIISLIPVLPFDYDFDTIKILLEQYYPYEIFFLQEKYEYYLRKEKSLLANKKKPRYQYKSVDHYVKHSNIFNRTQDLNFIENHQNNFDSNAYEDRIRQFEIQRNPKIQKTYKKIQTSIKKTQQLEPTYLDSLIGLYNKKRTTQKDKVYILKELEKYYCPKIITFFSKLVDTEYNRQLREEACYFLQSLGYQPRLPRQKYIRIPSKNKQKREYYREYANETFIIQETPSELEYRINNAKEQIMKQFDFFISHSSLDYTSIQLLIESLNKTGNNVYCDWINDTDYLKRHLVGDHTLGVIKKRMDQSKKMIYVLSDNSLKSKWCEYEINYFNNQKKEILFIHKNDISEKYVEYSSYDLFLLLKPNFENLEKKLFQIT